MIKLDRALITGIHHDPAKQAHIAALTDRHDARLIAVGIEHPAELATLAGLRVPLGQGYHLGRPARPWSPITESAGRALRPGSFAHTSR